VEGRGEAHALQDFDAVTAEVDLEACGVEAGVEFEDGDSVDEGGEPEGEVRWRRCRSR
jgi:hypothetical protein